MKLINKHDEEISRTQELFGSCRLLDTTNFINEFESWSFPSPENIYTNPKMNYMNEEKIPGKEKNEVAAPKINWFEQLTLDQYYEISSYLTVEEWKTIHENLDKEKNSC